MTKQIIDADALLEWAEKNSKGISYEDDDYYLRLGYLETYVNELATPAPEPQESIFDEDGWCWDLSKAPKDTYPPLLVKTTDSYTTTYNFRGLNEKDHICWKLILPPTLPTGGNK